MKNKPAATLDEVNSTLISRNIVVGSRRTSVRLEADMWVALFDIAARERTTIHIICTRVDEYKKPRTSLTAAIRVFIMSYYRAAATEDGHNEAGHGRGHDVMSRVFAARRQAEMEAQAERKMRVAGGRY